MTTSQRQSVIRERIAAAYDPEFVRSAGLRLVELLADHLAKVESGQGPVLNWSDPPTTIAEADEWLDRFRGTDRNELADHFGSLVSAVLARGQNLHHPHYIGHQVPASVPFAGLFDAVGSVTNQVMAIYEMGPWASSVEQAMVDRVGRQIGWESNTFAGVVTHGGSLANLTGLLTARNVTLGDVWERGLAAADSREAPVLVAHAESHYGVTRAAGVLGVGTNNIVRASLDHRRRMDPGRLDDTLQTLKAQNRPVVAVSANACATPIGAFDRLHDIADVCSRHNVWLHVDAAHGGAACFSDKYRHLVDGLHRADSVVLDGHKMMFAPALCAFVFLRNRSHRFETFRQDAPYLFDPSAPGMAEFDSGTRTVECTKRAATFSLWGIWSLFGPELFADMVDSTFDLGRVFHGMLSEAPDFETLHEPECNIVAFRYHPESLRDAPPDVIDGFQRQLRRDLIQSGDFYITQTQLDGQAALRVTIINPLTTADHLESLMETLRTRGAALTG